MVVGLLVWVLWGDSLESGFIGIATVPVVGLLLMGVGLGAGGIISDESANDTYSVQHANRMRRFGGGESGRRILSFAAYAAALTSGLIAAVVYLLQ